MFNPALAIILFFILLCIWLFTIIVFVKICFLMREKIKNNSDSTETIQLHNKLILFLFLVATIICFDVYFSISLWDFLYRSFLYKFFV